MGARRWFTSTVARLVGNDQAQRLLWWVIDKTLVLLGIGSGTYPSSSGETVIIRRLRQLVAGSGAPLCIFDVGAHEGEFLDSIVRPLTKLKVAHSVHAFEPSRDAFAVLQQRHGQLQNTILNEFALGQSAGEVDLHADSPGSELASFSKRRLDHLARTFNFSEKVSVQTLDEYCSAHGVEIIDLLKLDVEGHELEVIQGAARMFRERRIRLVTFEFGGCNIDSRTFFQDYWYFIQDNKIGDLFRMTPSGYLAPITAYSEAHEQFRTTNYLLVCSNT